MKRRHRVLYVLLISLLLTCLAACDHVTPTDPPQSTPGEYLEDRHLGYAIALYAYEADVVGLVCAADEPYSLFSPCCASQVNREVIGIITKIDKPNARVDQVRLWLEIAGCKKIFCISSYDGEGVNELLEYLMEGGNASANSFEEAVDFNR